MGIALWDNLKAQPDAARALQNYRWLAAGYDVTCTRIVALRQRAVRELNLRRGETVLDIACGTGPTLPELASAVGPTGRVIGVELSPEMAASARRRVEALGLSESVRIHESAVESMQVSPRADALLLCYTHDVLQSPLALERMILSAKPGARLAIVGMKTLPWLWGWPANLFNLYRARRYLTTFRNLRRPWQLFEQRGAVLRVVHSALWGSAYIAVGALADTRPPSSPAPLFNPSSNPLQAESPKANR